MNRATAAATDSPRVDLAEIPDFDLGGVHVSPARRKVRKDGQHRDLEPKVARVLVALAAARSQVVSRDRLIEQCWDGRIVGDDALNRCIVALRHLAKEFTPEPYAITTVPRVGYSLTETVLDEVARPASRRPLARLAVAAIVALLIAVAALFAWSRLGPAEAEPASIAVLPFRNLSSGDPYFAEGIGEEILGQLSREPQFRVAGSSSSSQFGPSPDIRTVARKLNVEYVLEGSVRRQGDKVRVSAALIRASDRTRVWGDSYDGKLDDILSIQAAIGQAVAGGLRLRLVRSTAITTRPVNGDAYALFLNARGLLRTRNPALGHDALGLLQRALRIDPSYAPAWSSLAEALQRHATTQGPEGLIAVLPQARAAARRALQLDPNLGAAHGNLGVLLGYDSPEANGHFRRAAALDPRSSESQVWLGMAHLASAEFAKERAAYERAHALDPLWHRPIRDLAYVLTEMGDRSAAEALLRRDFADDDSQRQINLIRIARLSGDYSEVARLGPTLERTEVPARHALADARFLLNLSTVPPHRATANLDQPRFNPRIWTATAPSAAEWHDHNRSPDAALIYADENLVAAKLMLLAGRSRELVATFDGPIGLLKMKPGEPVLASELHQAPLVALALRAVGRDAEASRILGQADALVQTAYRRGKVPNWFEADAAAVWAVQGRSDRALDAIERAFSRGWRLNSRDSLRDIADEPAFQPLHGNSRFVRLQAQIAAHHAREREEILRLQLAAR